MYLSYSPLLLLHFVFYTQIIEASENFAGVKTFGYSLAGNLDVDNNGYPGMKLLYETFKIALCRSVSPEISLVSPGML